VTREAHYLRIANQIAARIDSGELKPGDAVPSARQIVREWGVAMATATRVLARLKVAGLVDPIPGRGTLVRPRLTGHDPHDERADIIDEAIRLADEDGLELLTMRRLAAVVGMPTMSLYRRTPSRSELIHEMTERVFADFALPALPVERWRERLEEGARRLRGVFARHPWSAGVISLTRPQPLASILTLVEWNLATLHALGLSTDDAVLSHINLFNLVVSVSRAGALEAQARADTGYSIDEWAERQRWAPPEAVREHSVPTFERVVQQGFDYDLDRVFEFGLRAFLDGIATRRNTVS
jgi:DNA-binding transcriptional regulator YhcF (GntR family)